MKWLFIFSCFFSCLTAKPIKVIIFDYGKVMATIDRRPMLHFLSESFDIPYEKIKQDFSKDRLYKALNRSTKYWQSYSNKPLCAKWALELEKYKREIIQETPKMADLIKSLKEQKIEVILLSNTKKHRGRFIAEQGGYAFFDLVLLSCDLGVKKPETEIYTQLLKRLKHPAKDCLLIDNKRKNIEEGKRCGIDGIVFSSSEQLKRKLQEYGVLEKS